MNINKRMYDVDLRLWKELRTKSGEGSDFLDWVQDFQLKRKELLLLQERIANVIQVLHGSKEIPPEKTHVGFVDNTPVGSALTVTCGNGFMAITDECEIYVFPYTDHDFVYDGALILGSLRRFLRFFSVFESDAIKIC